MIVIKDCLVFASVYRITTCIGWLEDNVSISRAKKKVSVRFMKNVDRRLCADERQYQTTMRHFKER